MLDNWLARWQEGRIGWHEADGNVLLRRHWPRLVRGTRVLVPLCGKSVDMLWLARQGLNVTGVEVSEVAVREFFEENEIPYRVGTGQGPPTYTANEAPIRLVCGDYLAFVEEPFGALYDRGALVAIPAPNRPAYVAHTKSLLEPGAWRMVITLRYDQSRVDGPPYSVDDAELSGYWPDLHSIESRNEVEHSPPKFHDAGITDFIESAFVPD